jgi:hypothetical protein
VLHEDTIANIRALAPDPEEFERKFTAGRRQVASGDRAQARPARSVR